MTEKARMSGRGNALRWIYPTGLSDWLHVHDSPQIPASQRPVRLPAFRPAQNRSRPRQRLHAVGDRKSFSHTEIAERQDVQPAEIKDEEHLRAPSADPLD